MAENDTDHMLNIANFVTATVYVATADGWINQLSQQMDIVWKIKTFLRANVVAKKYRFARTFRLVENRLNDKFYRKVAFLMYTEMAHVQKILRKL